MVETSDTPARNGTMLKGQQTNGKGGRTEVEIKALNSFRRFGELLDGVSTSLGAYFDDVRGKQEKLQTSLDAVDTSMATARETARQASEDVRGMRSTLESELAEIRGTANDASSVSENASADAAAAQDKAEQISGRVDSIESAYEAAASSAVSTGVLTEGDVKGKPASEKASILLSTMLSNYTYANGIVAQTLELVGGIRNELDAAEAIQIPEPQHPATPSAAVQVGEKPKSTFYSRVGGALKSLAARVKGAEDDAREVRGRVDNMDSEMESVASTAVKVGLVEKESIDGKTASGKASKALAGVLAQFAGLKDVVSNTLELVGTMQSSSDVGEVPDPQNLNAKIAVGGEGQTAFPSYVIAMFETVTGNLAEFRRTLREYEHNVKLMVASEVGIYITGAITPRLDEFGQRLASHDANVGTLVESEVARVVEEKVEGRLNMGAETFQDLRMATGIPIGKEKEMSLNSRLEALEQFVQSLGTAQPDADAQERMTQAEQRLTSLESRLAAVEEVKEMLTQLIRMQLDVAKPEGS